MQRTRFAMSIFAALVLASSTGCSGSGPSASHDAATTRTGRLVIPIRHEQTLGARAERPIEAEIHGVFLRGSSTIGSTKFDLTAKDTYRPPGDARVSGTAEGLRPGQWKITLRTNLSGWVICNPVTVPTASVDVTFDKDGNLLADYCEFGGPPIHYGQGNTRHE
jgi:hypothetical protein